MQDKKVLGALSAGIGACLSILSSFLKRRENPGMGTAPVRRESAIRTPFLW